MSPISPVVERMTQQFDVSSNWFNVPQQMRFAGDAPKVKFLHVKYVGLPDDENHSSWDPIVVVTLEFTPISGANAPGRLVWEDEIPFIVIVNSEEGAVPARPLGYETIMTATGKDGRLFELAVIHKTCDRCKGSGEMTAGIGSLDVTTLGSGSTKFVAGPGTLKVVCTVCGGTGKLSYV